MNTVNISGVSFNADANYHLTEQEFMDSQAHYALSAEQLKEAYKLIKAVPVAKIPQAHVPYVPAKMAKVTDEKK